jgi:thiol-disulfide isomerase/thioredoxin
MSLQRQKAKMSAILVTLLVYVIHPVNANAPGTELVRIDGVTQPMSDYIGNGKWVVINVWSPTCAACVKELPEIEAFRKKHINDVQLLGLTIDFPSFEYGKIDIINEFLQKSPIHYPLFLADIELASEVIGNWLVAIPLMAIFHPDGRVLARWPGYVDTGEIEEFMQNYKDYIPDDELSVDFD